MLISQTETELTKTTLLAVTIAFLAAPDRVGLFFKAHINT